MKATYDDTILMDRLLLDARAVLAEAEEIGMGRKVRLTLYRTGGSMKFVLPWRVAAYARKVLGEPAPLCEVAKISFTYCGCTLVHLPTEDGYQSFIRAILAYSYAGIRRSARLARQLRKQGGISQKGGHVL